MATKKATAEPKKSTTAKKRQTAKTEQKPDAMKRERLPNGNTRLSSPSGVVDTRTGRLYTSKEVKPREEKYYKEAINEK